MAAIIANVMMVNQSPHVLETKAHPMTTVPMPKDCTNIFNLPDQTAPKFTPRDSATWRSVWTNISLAVSIIAIDHRMRPRVNAERWKFASFGWATIAKQTKAPQTRTLSASGSRVLPSLLVALKALATIPSTMSVSPAITKSEKPTVRKSHGLGPYRGAMRIITRKITVITRRASVRALGICRIIFLLFSVFIFSAKPIQTVILIKILPYHAVIARSNMFNE